MPKYILPNGKSVWTEKPIPDNELDSFLSTMMEPPSNDVPSVPTTRPTTQQPTTQQATPEGPPQKGLLQKWDEQWFNQPLSHLVTGGSLAPAAGNLIDDPMSRREDQWRIPDWVPIAGGGTYRSLLGGMAEGGTNLAEGLTTPLNLATMGSAGVYNRTLKTARTLPALSEAAYTTAPRVANAARRTTQALSVPVVGSGVARTNRGIQGGADYEGDTDWSDVGMGLVEIAGGIAGTQMPKGPQANPRIKNIGDSLTKPNSGIPQELIDTHYGLEEGPLPVSQPAAAPTFDDWLSKLSTDDPNMNAGAGNPELAGSTPYPVGNTGMPTGPVDQGFMTPFTTGPHQTIQRPAGGWPMRSATPPETIPAQSLEPVPNKNERPRLSRGMAIPDPTAKYEPDPVLNQKLQDFVTQEGAENLERISRMRTEMEREAQAQTAQSTPLTEPIQPITQPTTAGVPRFGDRGPGGSVDPITGELIEGPIAPQGQVIDGSHPNDPFLLDSARMQEEAARRANNYDPVREADHRQWNERQRAGAEYEGNFNTPNTVEYSQKSTAGYTPEQLAVKASWDRMQFFKDDFSRWFAEQEALLPEDEFFTVPPEIKAEYDANLAKLEAAHDANYAKLKGKTEVSAAPSIIEGSVVSSEPTGNPLTRFLKEESGELDVDRLKYLYDRYAKGVITEAEMMEAKQLARGAASSAAQATSEQLPATPRLSPDLQGAKPRFNMGSTSYEPVFANDLDKALFIIGQKTPSKRNADYLAYVMKVTGLDEKGALAAAAEVRAKIKAGVTGQPAGQVRLKPLYGAPAEAAKVQPNPTLTSAPIGQTIKIAQANANPELIKQAKEAGFDFKELDAQGNFILVKSRESGTAPILEGEVGTSRPTPSGVKEHLGPLADQKRSSPIVEAFNFPRGVMAAMDFSAPLRQGIALIHKPAFWKALKPMFKAWATEEGFRASQNAIAQRPLFRERAGVGGKVLPSFADDAGLKLSDLTDLTKREEAIMSTWAELVPGVRRSNRAYTAFLNNLRADVFESLVKDGQVFGANTKANLPLARELANFVNTASGRGSLGQLERSAVALNTMFFSPRLIASRLQMMNPHYYITANPMVRKEALKSLVAIAAAGNTVTQIGKMITGGTVGSDPNSSDFGKLRIGNTRIDPYGGFQQYIVAMNRLLRPESLSIGDRQTDTGFAPLDQVTGMLSHGGQQVASSSTDNRYNLWNQEGPFDPTHADVAGRFIRGKMHPVLGFAWSLLSGRKEMSGEDMNFSSMNPMENAVAQRFIPILMQDLYELSQDPDMPPALKAVVALSSTFGMGSQTYDNFNDQFDEQ